jgi:protein TonB
MSYAQQRNSGRLAIGFGLVLLLHIGAVYLVVSGLGKQIVEKIRQPLETKILDDKPPPPPDLPPPPPPPPPTAPPPVFIPPPEIVITAPTPPPPVQAAVVVPPPAPAPVTRPAPVAPPPPDIPDRNVSAKPIAGPPLQYPKRMQDSGREGSVDVECDVDTDGRTSNCSVVNTSGGSAFADAAMAYVQASKYSPEIQHGVAVKVRHKWVITFKLN